MPGYAGWQASRRQTTTKARMPSYAGRQAARRWMVLLPPAVIPQRLGMAATDQKTFSRMGGYSMQNLEHAALRMA